MRIPVMAGNWKMNKSVDEASVLARAIHAAVAEFTNVERVVCPATVCLPAVQAVLQHSPVAVGAQNVHWAENGAFTGEVSAPMLRGLAGYVIIGHSERRQFFCETDETVNKKIKTALAHNLTPIVCIGESLAQNQAGETADFVGGQVRAALAGLSGEQVQTLILAYEPIWAIGTGLAATAEQAQQVCGALVRQTLVDGYGREVAAVTRILYGGSTNENNIGEIMRQPDIDGALIGGASLKAESYAAMVRTTSELYKARQA